MPGIDPVTGTFALPWWVVAAAAALLLVLCVRAFSRPGTVGLGVAAAVAGAATVAWLVVDHSSNRDRSAERRALEGRAADLSVRAIEQGSPLACLDGLAGDVVEAACEKAVFADAETVAAAISYVSARLTLLNDMSEYTRGQSSDVDELLLGLRRAIETDRFGMVAHVLAVRDGCTGETCPAFGQLRDASRVRANLNARLLDRYLDRYASEWAKAPEAPVAELPPAMEPPPSPKPKVSANVDFPSAESIPRVSIMNPEPTGPVLPGVAAAAAANPNPPGALSATPAPRRARKPPPAPPPPVQAQVGGATGAPVVPPVKLVPFPPPEANAGLTRAQ